jgi:hypothetical protein
MEGLFVREEMEWSRFSEMEVAWCKVFNLCLELGMDVENLESGIDNVLNFIENLAKEKK